VDRADVVRPRQDELVEAGSLGDSAREEQGADGAVGHERSDGEARAEAVALRRAHGSLTAEAAHAVIVPCASGQARRQACAEEAVLSRGSGASRVAARA